MPHTGWTQHWPSIILQHHCTELWRDTTWKLCPGWCSATYTRVTNGILVCFCQHIKALLISLVLEWNTSSEDILSLILGKNCLSKRYYSDSQGIVNFANNQGGLLIPLVGEGVRLTYDTFTRLLSVAFRFERQRDSLMSLAKFTTRV